LCAAPAGPEAFHRPQRCAKSKAVLSHHPLKRPHECCGACSSAFGGGALKDGTNMRAMRPASSRIESITGIAIKLCYRGRARRHSDKHTTNLNLGIIGGGTPSG
jgi:hypothetical protein